MRKSRFFCFLFILAAIVFLFSISILFPNGYQYKNLEEIRSQENYPNGELLCTIEVEGKALEFVLSEDNVLNILTIKKKWTAFGKRYCAPTIYSNSNLKEYAQRTERYLSIGSDSFWDETSNVIPDVFWNTEYWCIARSDVVLPTNAEVLSEIVMEDDVYVLYLKK